MKTESTILAENFKSGSLKPIIEKMIEEFPVHGLQENQKISKTELASYIAGQMVARIGKSNNTLDSSFGWTDKYIYQENANKPIQLDKTLQKPGFISGIASLPRLLQDMYPEMVLLPASEMDGPLFWSGLFSEQVKMERERIGLKIKTLRELAGMTQDQLAEKTGLLRPNINRIEAGKYSTGQDILSKIARALGKTVDFV